MAIRLLGEDLILFEDRQGELGLIDQRCPHRGVSLVCGIPESNGLRCPYHGWLFDEKGECIERPYEDAHEKSSHHYLKRPRIKSYQVESIGGIIFAWLGPQPAPVCPDWGLLRRTDIHREVRIGMTPCNWFQIMENAVDPVHHEWLHGHFSRYIQDRQRSGEAFGHGTLQHWAHHDIEFRSFPYGINKCRLVAGENKESAQWTIGHPVLFPNVVWFQKKIFWRVPIDDKQTLNVGLVHRTLGDDERYEEAPEYTADDSPALFSESGAVQWQHAGSTGAQDEIVWIAQGQIADRSKEHLASSDQGVLMLRRLFYEQLKKVKANEEPMNVFHHASEIHPELIRCAPTLQDSLPLV